MHEDLDWALGASSEVGSRSARSSDQAKAEAPEDEVTMKRCEWCKWWGHFGWYVQHKYKLVHVDSCPPEPQLLCLRCLLLDEPPWRPNNRDCWHEWLLQVLRTTELNSDVQRTIAEYLAQNVQ